MILLILIILVSLLQFLLYQGNRRASVADHKGGLLYKDEQRLQILSSLPYGQHHIYPPSLEHLTVSHKRRIRVNRDFKDPPSCHDGDGDA